MRTYLERKLDDGTRLIEHFENDVVVGTTRIVHSPGGRTTTRQFDATGVLLEEIHSHGSLLAFSVITKYRDGIAVEEQYFRKRRLVSREAYLKALADYPDMPRPSLGVPDIGGELQAAVAQERRQQRKRAKTRVADPGRGAALDAFCGGLMQQGEVREAREWFAGAKARLGERDRRSSRNLLEGIYRHGALRVWACDIETDVDGASGTSHLVVELPAEAGARAKLLRYLARPARQQGLEGDADDGQQFVYVKLD